MLALGLSLMMLATLCGCGDDGTGGALCEAVKCPAGFTCVEQGGQARCVGPDAGGDSGPRDDVGPREASTPKKDKGGPGKDLPGPKKDKGGPQKDLDTKQDQGSTPDLPPGSPVQVKLSSPADKSSTGATKLQFKFSVTSKNNVARCELFLDGKKASTLKNPGPAPKFTLDISSLKDGKHTWSVKCTDVQNKKGGSPVWSFTTAPQDLTGCKSGGFTADTRYRLKADIKGGTGDCFVVDASGVHINGNGKTITAARYKDLLLHRDKSMNARVLKNPGPSGAWTVTWSSPYSDYVGEHPTAADFTGDGMLDLVLPDLNGSLHVFNNAGKGTFNSKPAYSSKNKNQTSPRAVDFNQDGHMDLALAGSGAKEELLINTGLAGLALKGTYDWGNLTRNLDPVDFNGDAVIDLVAGNAGYGYVAGPRMALKGGMFGSSFYFSTAWKPNDSRGEGPTFVADFNGDGDWDLLTRYHWLNQISSRIFLGAGNGTFKLSSSYNLTRPLAARDMNGDGNTDMVLLHGSPTSASMVRVYLGNGKGQFTSVKSLSPGGSITSTLVRDLDGDGLPEVVLTAGTKGSSLIIYQNQLKGGSSFKQLLALKSSGSARILDARDMNNDGLLDLISESSSWSRAVYLLTQSAPMKFSAKVLMTGSGGTSFRAFALGDLTASPARAVYIKKGADGVTLTKVGAIRGYSTGVHVEGDKAHLNELVVEDTDLHGVKFKGVTSGKVEKLTTRNMFQGVGLALDNATIVTVNNCDLCDGGYDPRLTAVGARCVKSAANGINNRLRLNNGCTTLAYKTCR